MKNLYLFGFTVFFLSILLFFLSYSDFRRSYPENNRDSNSREGSLKENEYNSFIECLRQYNQEELVGNWEPFKKERSPKLSLTEKEFELKYNPNSFVGRGNWIIDFREEPYIKLIFTELDENWKKHVTEQDVNEIDNYGFGTIDSKFFVDLRMGNGKFTDKENQVCDSKFFYIDILNTLLYKNVDDLLLKEFN